MSFLAPDHCEGRERPLTEPEQQTAAQNEELHRRLQVQTGEIRRGHRCKSIIILGQIVFDQNFFFRITKYLLNTFGWI